ncbi:MAG: GNAT family N-acetyltransferase [Slackia sp.]|nr:GNAT family N-acetyltransferase [Slackia sp.]
MDEPLYTYRLAVADDAEALQAIYAPYVETSITFECVCPTVEEFRRRIEERICLYPYVVCEEDGVPVGYAYASRMFSRQAYDWAVELSVYIAQDCKGRGLGRALYARLIALLEMQGVRSIHGKVTEPNEKSDKLHLAMGFRLVGIMDNVGFKLGRWRDVAHYEKLVGDFSRAPEPLIPVGELPADNVAAVLEGRL